MHLEEDREHGECDVNIVGLRILYNALIDRMLGTGVEAQAQWCVGALRQVGVYRYGDTSHTGSCASAPILAGDMWS